MGRKLGVGGCAPLGEGELGTHLKQCGQGRAYLPAKFHLDPSNRLATVHERHRQIDRQDRAGQTGQTDRQRTDSIGRTVFTNGRPKSCSRYKPTTDNRYTLSTCCNCLELPENACCSLYRTDTISQSLFATRFANWYFSLTNKSNLVFPEVFGNENYRLALSDEKHLATVFTTSSKIV